MNSIKRKNLILPPRLIRLLLYLFTSGLILMIFIVHPGINGYSAAMFNDMIYGHAHRPFVYRTLVPSVVRLIADITPESVETAFVNHKNSSFTLTRFAELSGIDDEYVYEFYITIALLLILFYGLALVTRRLIKEHYDFPNYVSDFAPIAALLILPLFFRYCNYIYDPATLFLASLALLFISTRNRFLFYIVFILAAINKETAILFSCLFFVKEYRTLTRKTLIGHLIVQLLIWGAIKSMINIAFQNNPGSIAEFHLVNYNLQMIFRPFGILYFAAVVFIFFRLIKYRWQEKSMFLRRGFFVVFIPMAVLALFLGYIDEFRQYYEVYPIAFLLILPSVLDIFGINTYYRQQNAENYRPYSR